MAGVVHPAHPCRGIRKVECWRCLLEKKRSKQRTLCCQEINGYSSIVQEGAEVVENSAGGQLAVSVDPHCNAWSGDSSGRMGAGRCLLRKKGSRQGTQCLMISCHDMEMLRYLTEGQGVAGDSGWILKM